MKFNNDAIYIEQTESSLGGRLKDHQNLSLALGTHLKTDGHNVEK